MTVAATALLAWAAVVGAVSLRAAWGRAPSRDNAVGAFGDVLVVRPCAGTEPRLAETLASTRALPRDARVVFAVARADDPAHDVAQAAAEALRADGRDVTVRLTHAAGANQKSAQLAAVLAAEPGAVVVNLDSDVDCATVDLGALVGALTGDGGLGAVWAPVVEDGGVTLGDRASDALLAGSLHAFPLLAALDPDGLVGKVVALRRDALQRIGGFEALTDYLGEDMELARRLRAAGLRTQAAPFVAVSRVQGRSWGAVVARYARWITVIRAQRPALLLSYPGLFFATPLLVVGGLAAGAPAVAALALGARLVVAVAARRASGSVMTRALADVVLADALLMSAFVKAMATREVRWRGRVLAVDAGGTLREVSHRPPAHVRA